METAEHLEPLFGFGMFPLKICIVVIYIVLAGLIFEPQKMKAIGMASAGLILLIGTTYYSLMISKSDVH